MKWRSAMLAWLAVVILSAPLLAQPGAPPAQAQAGPSLAGPVANTEPLPPGVSVQTVLAGMDSPVAMAFDPSGRLFYTQKNGAVRLFANGKLQDAPVIRFNVDTSGERGLLGIAIDPAFTSNHYIYVYYTCSTQSGDCPSTENRVARFVENNGTGANPQTIFTSRQTAPFHVGGNIHFGPDGKLYVTIGETGNPANSQDVGVTQGKIHRLNPDGTAPGDNPNLGRAGALPTIYAYGLRNSFDFAFDPVSKRLFASENGPGCDDELNLIQPGANYGWRDSYPCDDAGPDPAFNTIRPLWYLPQGTCCVAPTGITVYSGGQIPQWTNHIFMANYKDPLYHLTPNAGRTGLVAAAKVEGLGPGMDIETGPDGALYYIEGGGYQDGTLKRITGPGGPPQPPTPGASPVPTVAVPGTGSTTFPETGMTMAGLFRDYWNRNGGLPQQGFPISPVMGEVSDLNGKPYTVQYFERAVFEYHPENQPPFNVLLSQLGTFRYRQKYPDGAPGQKPNTTAGSVRVPETGKRLGGLFLKYWQEHGGLPQQGYPISDEFMEKSDLNGKEYLVQYFERAVFELHPENAGNQYEVLLSQLGTFRYREKHGK